MRRRLLLILWLTALTLQGFATAQEADVVYVDGIAYALLARPIVQNETLFQSLQGLVDKEKGSRTSNWDGFKGYWTIANGQLLLDSVGYVSKKGDGYAMLDKCSFNRIFKAYLKHGHVVAKWVSGTLRYGRGDLVRYVHDGFDRNYVQETMADVLNGNVTKQRTFRNEKLAGLSPMQLFHPDSIENHIPLADIPELEGHSIVLQARLFPSSWGQMADSCRVEIMRMWPD